MYDERIEGLIDAALADGEITDKERKVLFKNAEAQGIDLDEFEMVLDARLVKIKKQTAAPTPPPVPTPKSAKHGRIRKCPACGATLQPFDIKCPDCGQEFLETETVNSAAAFFKLLKNTDTRNREQAILNFPIPNNKEDLMEMLTLSVSNACTPSGKTDDVWIQKTDHIYQKIVLSSANDMPLLLSATELIASLMSRLPISKQNFTRIPASVQQKVNTEVKRLEQEQIAKKKEARAREIKEARNKFLLPALGVFLFLFIGSWWSFASETDWRVIFLLLDFFGIGFIIYLCRRFLIEIGIIKES